MRTRIMIPVVFAALATTLAGSARGQTRARTVVDSASRAAAPRARLYYRVYDSAATTAGLQPLRTTVLPAGEREVRIWTQLEIAIPKSLYRIVDAGGRTTGDLIYYWAASPYSSAPSRNSARGAHPSETLDDRMRRSLAGRCDHFVTHARMTICRVRFTRPPDWGGVLRRMEAHGLWSIPDPSELQPDSVIVFDGWTIGVEVRDGASYHAYQYNNPESHPKWPTAKNVLAIASELHAVDSLIAPSAGKH